MGMDGYVLHSGCFQGIHIPELGDWMYTKGGWKTRGLKHEVENKHGMR